MNKLAPDPNARDWSSLAFTAFCAELGVVLESGQSAFAMVAYDGLEPRDLPPQLRALALLIFGHCETIPPEARGVVALVAGGRGGKTYLAALRVLHLALTVSLAPLAPGERAFGVIFSGDPRQREQCLRYALGAARSHPGIKRMLNAQAEKEDFSGSSFTLRRRDGVVTIESLPPKPGGGSGRGRSLVCAVLEEAAFMQDENHVVNDVDVFKAVTPRVLPGGQTILSSTPWAEDGVLFDEFTANHPSPKVAAPHLKTAGRPHRAIAAHAPTLLLRDVPYTRQIVGAERARDPQNAAREYDAQFLPIGSSQFFDAVSLADAADPALELGSPRSGNPQSICVVGADLGFVNDAATAVTVERSPTSYALLHYLELFPSVEGLKPSQVFDRVAGEAATYGAEDIVADQHYALAAKEAFWHRGKTFVEFPGGAIGKAEAFAALDRELRERRVRLPNDARLLQQLREVRKRPKPGGGYSIEQPRHKPRSGDGAQVSGGHGDVVSGLVGAVWWLSRLELPAAAPEVPADPVQASAAAWQQRTERRIEERVRDAELEQWGVFRQD